MSSDVPEPPARVPIGLRVTPRALARLADRERAITRYAAPALRRSPKRAGAVLRLAAVVLPASARAGVAGSSTRSIPAATRDNRAALDRMATGVYLLGEWHKRPPDQAFRSA